MSWHDCKVRTVCTIHRHLANEKQMQVYALQGALLLVLFNVSHAVEHLLIDKAQGNLASLLEKAPQTATILQATAEGQPDFSQTDTVRAEDVHIGSLMLVRPGEQVVSVSESHLHNTAL